MTRNSISDELIIETSARLSFMVGKNWEKRQLIQQLVYQVMMH